MLDSSDYSAYDRSAKVESANEAIVELPMQTARGAARHLGLGNSTIFTLARFALRYPRRILVVASLFLVAAGLFGAPVSTSLPAGGYDVPRSESARAEHILEDKFDASGMSVETKNFSDLEFRCPAGLLQIYG